MSKCYFYTDPLAASWMAKHFGMRFVCEFTAGERREFGIPATDENFLFSDCGFDGGSIERWGEIIETSKKFRKIILHPDWDHLLEPQKDDVVEDKGITGVWPVYGTVTVFQFPIETADTAIGVNSWCAPTQSKNLRVIQRNGLAFHYPESEDK
jgi:hypothetical protein